MFAGIDCHEIHPFQAIGKGHTQDCEGSNTKDYFQEHNVKISDIQAAVRHTAGRKDCWRWHLLHPAQIKIWACQHHVEVNNYRCLTSCNVAVQKRNKRTERRPACWSH